MKNIVTILLLLAVFASCKNKPAHFEEKKLAVLGKVWGFLKYYHPQVAKGKTNWDSVLIANIPLIKNAKDIDAVNEQIGKLISSAGEVAVCTNCQNGLLNSAFLKNCDFKWQDDNAYLSEENRKQLQFIRNNAKLDSNFYVQVNEDAGNATFENEKPYAEMIYPDESFRLLSLFRYWNAINYFFAYKYKTDINWDAVLEQSIADFTGAKDAVAYNLAFLKLAQKINDSHGMYQSKVIDDFIGNRHPVFGLATIEDKTVVQRSFQDDWMKQCPVKIGDVIIKVNGKPVEQLIDSMRHYVRGSNIAVQNRNINLYLLRNHNDSIDLAVERNTKQLNYRVACYPIDSMNFLLNPPDTIPTWTKLPGNIGYIDLGELEERQVDSAMKALYQTKAIIFDVRNYPQFIIHKLANYLLPKKERFVRFTLPDITHPGVFTENITTNDAFTGPLNNNENYYKGKVVVLLNEITQSRAEFTCMMFQKAPRSTLIGSQTSGADGNETSIVLPGGIAAHFTGLGVYYPNWKETQRTGIIPDIEIRPTVKGIRDGKDEVLQRALDFIETGK